MDAFLEVIKRCDGSSHRIGMAVRKDMIDREQAEREERLARKSGGMMVSLVIIYRC